MESQAVIKKPKIYHTGPCQSTASCINKAHPHQGSLAERPRCELRMARDPLPVLDTPAAQRARERGYPTACERRAKLSESVRAIACARLRSSLPLTDFVPREALPVVAAASVRYGRRWPSRFAGYDVALRSAGRVRVRLLSPTEGGRRHGIGASEHLAVARHIKRARPARFGFSSRGG